LTLSGPDSAAFEIAAGGLYLKAGTALDYETKASYSVTVSLTDSTLPDMPPLTADYQLAVTDVNEAPTAVGFTDAVTNLPENTSTAERIRLADIAVTDDALGALVFSLSGTDADAFVLDGRALYLKAGTPLDFEAKAAYAVTVVVADSELPDAAPVTADFTLTVTDVNEAPTAVTVTDPVASVAESYSVSERIKVGTISIIDDARVTAQEPESSTPPSAGKVERTGKPSAAAMPVTSW